MDYAPLSISPFVRATLHEDAPRLVAHGFRLIQSQRHTFLEKPR